jgi:hypothetical protein
MRCHIQAAKGCEYNQFPATVATRHNLVIVVVARAAGDDPPIPAALSVMQSFNRMIRERYRLGLIVSFFALRSVKLVMF